jgi:hypothetical protein
MSARGVLRALGRLAADIVVGDDWLIAAGVALALLATWGLRAAGVPAWWALPVAALSVTAASVRRALTREHGQAAAGASSTRPPR